MRIPKVVGPGVRTRLFVFILVVAPVDELLVPESRVGKVAVFAFFGNVFLLFISKAKLRLLLKALIGHSFFLPLFLTAR